ncbi:hypothetical protein BO83DRAFT_398670 [Aspergillus eucalypticola CBS 122712]|uniref:Uncharacterized protein n=1 Tax=Aspergillus eucalypticola (strain CBS 122712 / IBT 29274) TaxID=1448314 RepID=A0A317VIP7_ASPEC|nr:uncharacterized protein BO83DRAFT_398670 [Aspergillus eucalypticola CBS 122712]PWY74256.1 hypothetical protein BO83DRAFT_398670 [Aspergillus eucalypticola CBS 122712]
MLIGPRAAALPSAALMQELADAPGAGSLVAITDPEKFPFNINYNHYPINPSHEEPAREKIILKFPSEKPRLGHFGLSTQVFESQPQFHTSTFNIVTTDFIHTDEHGQRIPVTVFMHLYLGKEPVDHAFFLSANPKTSHIYHCSFEPSVAGQEEISAGPGVGHHVLGSQNFDYWWDVSGNMVELYADGDLVDAETPIGYVPAGPDSLAIWGTGLLATFVE